MALTISARALRARTFMQHCRLPAVVVHIRTSSSIPSFQSQIATTHGKSLYDPSNFSKPLHVPKALESAGHIYRHPRALDNVAETLPPPINYPARNWWQMVKMCFGWTPPPPEHVFKPAPIDIINNPYRSKKQWPPDIRSLPAKQQLHYEKTYRRRAKLAYTRPEWTRKIKMLQHACTIIVLVWFIFIDDLSDFDSPMDGFRAWFWSRAKNLAYLSDTQRANFEEAEQQARYDAAHRVKWSQHIKNWWNGRSEEAQAATAGETVFIGEPSDGLVATSTAGTQEDLPPAPWAKWGVDFLVWWHSPTFGRPPEKDRPAIEKAMRDKTNAGVRRRLTNREAEAARRQEEAMSSRKSWV